MSSTTLVLVALSLYPFLFFLLCLLGLPGLRGIFFFFGLGHLILFFIFLITVDNQKRKREPHPPQVNRLGILVAKSEMQIGELMAGHVYSVGRVR